jgi:hypothetical protein
MTACALLAFSPARHSRRAARRAAASPRLLTHRTPPRLAPQRLPLPLDSPLNGFHCRLTRPCLPPEAWRTRQAPPRAPPTRTWARPPPRRPPSPWGPPASRWAEGCGRTWTSCGRRCGPTGRGGLGGIRGLAVAGMGRAYVHAKRVSQRRAALREAAATRPSCPCPALPGATLPLLRPQMREGLTAVTLEVIRQSVTLERRLDSRAEALAAENAELRAEVGREGGLGGRRAAPPCAGLPVGAPSFSAATVQQRPECRPRVGAAVSWLMRRCAAWGLGPLRRWASCGACWRQPCDSGWAAAEGQAPRRWPPHWLAESGGRGCCGDAAT